MAGRSAQPSSPEACLDSRQRLLAAAWELLWLNSFATVSVDDLCRRAAVNKGSFYHHFESKVALAQAAFTQQWDGLRPVLDAAFSSLVPPLERIDRYAAIGLQVQREKAREFGRVLGCPWTSLGCEAGCKDDDLRAIAAQKGERVTRYLASAIRDAIALGQIPQGDPEELAGMCQALISGSAAQARITDSLQPFVRLAAALRRLLGAPPP